MLTSEVPFLPFYLFCAWDLRWNRRERGRKEGEGAFCPFTFLPFYPFTFLPLKKSLLFEGFEETLAHRLAILLCVSDVGENLG